MSESDTDALLVALGREVKAMRIKRGLSREELGERADVSERQVGKVERGERGQISEVWRIARALNVALSWLIAEAEVAEEVDNDDVSRSATLVHLPDGNTLLMPEDSRLHLQLHGSTNLHVLEGMPGLAEQGDEFVTTGRPAAELSKPGGERSYPTAMDEAAREQE